MTQKGGKPVTLKRYLILMIISTLVAWAAWWAVVNYLDPQATGNLSFWFFYLSLLIAIVGTATLIGFGLRRLIHRHDVIFRQVSISFRQGILLGIAIILSLLLQGQNLFTWWNFVILIAILTIIEFFFLSVRRAPPTQ